MTRPAWTSLDGNGSWQASEPRPILPSLAALVALLIGATLWLGLYLAGHALMCKAHANRLDGCPRAEQVQR